MNRALACVAMVLSGLSSNAHEPIFASVEGRKSMPFPGHDTYILAGSHNTASKTAVLEIEVPANTFGAPPHVHSHEDEHFYVLEGEVQFLDREQTISVQAGTLVVLPRGHLHGFWNDTDQPARMLLVITPGEFASFFDSVVGEIRNDSSIMPADIPALIAQVADRYGVEVRPDKIPSSASELLSH